MSAVNILNPCFRVVDNRVACNQQWLQATRQSLREGIKNTLTFENYVPDDQKISSHVDWSVIEPLILCCEKIEEQLKILEEKLSEKAKNDSVV